MACPDSFTLFLLGASFAVAVAHFAAEQRGRLWVTFGRWTHCEWLARLGHLGGLLVVTAPALALQSASAWGATHADSPFAGAPAVFWLACLIGAQCSDAWCSHLLPCFRGSGSPGLSTAPLYLLLAGALLGSNFEQLILGELWTMAGLALGVGFFVAVQPLFCVLGQIERAWRGF